VDTFEDIPNFNHRSGQPEKITVSTRWKKRSYGGWTLVEATTGRALGWITRNFEDPTIWEYRICSGAFRGDGIDDEGDVMDKVDPWLFKGASDGIGSRCLGTARDRWSAAHNITWHLVQHHAPAVGFGRHGMVEMSKWNRKNPAYKGSIQEDIDSMRAEQAGAR